MNNLFKVAALGLALTAGLSSCESKKTEETTVETPAGSGISTTVADSAAMAAPSTTDATAPAADAAAPAADAAAPAAGTTTTTTEEVKK